MTGDLGNEMDILFRDFCNDTGIFNYDAIKQIMRGESPAHAWYLFNFVLWHKHFIDGVSEENLLESLNNNMFQI